MTNISKQIARVLIVDDHALVRRGLAELVSDEDDLEVCGQAESAESAIQIVTEMQPDLVVVDIALGGSNGIELIKRIKARFPKIKMLVASMHDESLFAQRALRAGAMGYVNKEEANEKVVEAIRQVLDDKVYLSPQMTSRVLHGVAARPEDVAKSPIESLSDREVEVFCMIGRGMTTRQVAERLHLSSKTIETHREHIKTKLRVANVTELTRHAVQWVLENG